MISHHRNTRLQTRIMGTLLFVMTLLLGVVAPTYAAEPTKKIIPLIGTQVLADCGSFQVLDDYNVMIVQTDFYDNDGVRTAIHQMLNGTDTYRHSATGQSFTMKSTFMVQFDVATMINSSAGLQYHLTLPGMGNVLLDVGKTVFDLNAGDFIFMAGTHQVAEGDTAGLCAAFQ
ncbi:MAG: hypothetical protein R3E79_62065 [Caldilineaceae bacterium]